MANRIAGVCRFKVGDTSYALRGNITIMGLTAHKEHIVGLDGIHGYKEVPVAPKVSAEFSNVGNASASFRTLQAMGKREGIPAMNISVNAANGKEYMLYDGIVEGDVSYNPEDGMVAVTFSGANLREV